MSGILTPMLGTILLRVSVVGAVMTGFKFLWDGHFVLGAFVVVPLLGYTIWIVYEARFANDALLDDPF